MNEHFPPQYLDSYLKVYVEGILQTVSHNCFSFSVAFMLQQNKHLSNVNMNDLGKGKKKCCYSLLQCFSSRKYFLALVHNQRGFLILWCQVMAPPSEDCEAENNKGVYFPSLLFCLFF